MAGVMMASPKKSAAPTMPSRGMMAKNLPRPRMARAISESVPPSPLLSALSSTKTYFRVTMSSRAQMMRERMPSTMGSVTAPPASAAFIASRKA